MKAIRAFLLLTALALAAPAWAATILPLAETTFLDQNGAPLAGGQVYFFVPNTLTPKATYQNSAGSVSNTNPVTLDGSGRAIIYGAGQYRQQVFDVNGNLIWDQLTADTSGGATFSWAGTSAGTASAQTLSAPNFTSGDGQQIGFIAGFSNSGPLTVVVNGGSPISVIQASATGPQALGSVIAGNQYFISYSATNGNFQIDTLPAQAILPSSPIVAAATTDLGTLASHNANITGSTTITSFGSSASITSQFYFVTFAASPQITASASILTPGGTNIQAAPGQSAFLAYLGNGIWQVVSVTGASFAAPQTTVLTAGAGTYTTPTVNGARPLYLEVTDMCGAGSGGGGSGPTAGLGTAGGATTFGTSLLTANGAPATPANTSTTYPTPATATGGDTNISGGLGAGPASLNNLSANGYGQVAYGASSPLGNGGNPTVFNTGGLTSATSASGFCSGGGAGGIGSTGATYNSGWGGNAGAYLKATITSPAASYAYSVGAAGAGGVAGTNGSTAGNGAGGYIRVVAHWQ